MSLLRYLQPVNRLPTPEEAEVPPNDNQKVNQVVENASNELVHPSSRKIALLMEDIYADENGNASFCTQCFEKKQTVLSDSPVFSHTLHKVLIDAFCVGVFNDSGINYLKCNLPSKPENMIHLLRNQNPWPTVYH